MSSIMNCESGSQTAIDRSALLSAVEATLEIQTPQQFLLWTQNELQPLLPHKVLACGIGQVYQGGVRLQKLLCHNFPWRYLDEIRRPDGYVLSPVMANWCREQKPQLFESTSCSAAQDSLPGGMDFHEWLSIFNKYQLRNVAAHGMRDLDSLVTSYFSFSCIPEPLGRHHARSLEILMPHMHVTLKRVLEKIEPFNNTDRLIGAHLSPREREILRWIRKGKTNGEIARILSLSEYTVKNQVRALLVKLRASNRAEAVFKAIELRLD
ncbi:MAG: hypothetical protein IDH49_12645 [Gammaproteobacteria bacterium]|nr:hypothetical protein [Gammaproteobacteria bacterium]